MPIPALDATNRDRTSCFVQRRLAVIAIAFAAAVACHFASAATGISAEPAGYDTVRPLLAKYCLDCHSTEKAKGDLDLERFKTVDHIRKDLKVWENVLEMLDTAEMPPKKSPLPSDDERQTLSGWVRKLLDAEAHARSGDPGRVLVRRLSNAEYNNTLRDLLGVDLQPTKDFPGDGAAGEGFTNVGDGLVISPTLLNKYLNVSKELSRHLVPLPDGFRFSQSPQRQDWTDEVLDTLAKEYAKFGWGIQNGKINVSAYIGATIDARDDLQNGKTTIEEVAKSRGLNSRYLSTLWQALTGNEPSQPLDSIRAQWRTAGHDDIPAVTARIAAWQTALIKFEKVGSWVHPDWQVPNLRPLAASGVYESQIRPGPGQSEVVMYLVTRALAGGDAGQHVILSTPKFSRTDQQPEVLLRDVWDLGEHFQAETRLLLTGTARYLAAVIEAANDSQATPDSLAAKHSLNVDLLNRWIKIVLLPPRSAFDDDPSTPGVQLPLIPLHALKVPLEKKEFDGVRGWQNEPGNELPLVLSNSGEEPLKIPGTIGPHQVAVHPSATEFAAVAWQSPIAGEVRIAASVHHAHGCGNGVSWWVEQRSGNKVRLIGRGELDGLASEQLAADHIVVGKGDQLVLAVSAHNRDNSCDLTQIDFQIEQTAGGDGRWDLAKDVAQDINAGNPHAGGSSGNAVWAFVKGDDPQLTDMNYSATPPGTRIPGGSILARWRATAADPRRADMVDSLQHEIENLLTGLPPEKASEPDRSVYNLLVNLDGPLLRDFDTSKLAAQRRRGER